jgi:hypothetical protein
MDQCLLFDHYRYFGSLLRPVRNLASTQENKEHTLI